MTTFWRMKMNEQEPMNMEYSEFLDWIDSLFPEFDEVDLMLDKDC